MSAISAPPFLASHHARRHPPTQVLNLTRLFSWEEIQIAGIGPKSSWLRKHTVAYSPTSCPFDTWGEVVGPVWNHVTMIFEARVPSWPRACGGSRRPRTDTVYDDWGRPHARGHDGT